MEAKIILRAATPEDIESILAVQRFSPGPAARTPADYTSLLLAPGTICLLAEAPGGSKGGGRALMERLGLC
ncbi:MAG: hypothetical protein ACE5HL_00105 [Terriglobia bacterium]